MTNSRLGTEITGPITLVRIDYDFQRKQLDEKNSSCGRMLPMKMYVHGYWPRAIGTEQPGRPSVVPFENTEVAFSMTPAWRIATLLLAQRECEILQGMHVKVGYHHYCEFSVEELHEGEFAIVCLSHPDPLSKAPR
jgi:hypothetical protein